jgi:hypothetical protein
MQEVLETSILGRLPPEEEKRLASELLYHAEEAWARSFIPSIIIDKELVVDHLRQAKKKLEELGFK